MCILEEELALAECKGCTTDEDVKYRDWLRRLNALKKQQASRDGRHQFWRHFHHEVLNLLRKVARQTKLKDLKLEHQDLENRVRTISGKFASLEGRDANSKARIDAQLDLVRLQPLQPQEEGSLTGRTQLYNIIQQNESRSQFHIAATMSKDSADVAFLTKLGAFFLPAGVVGVGLIFLHQSSNTPKISLRSRAVFFGNTINQHQVKSRDCDMVSRRHYYIDRCRVIHPFSQTAPTVVDRA